MTLQLILGNFALVLFVLTIVTGIIWFLDRFYLRKQRRSKAAVALAEFDARNAKLSAEGIKLEGSGRSALEANLLRQPTWVEYSGNFFLVIALVFFLRSFLYEPFKIPSSSMAPTLLVGDLILVNKFTYGIRLPIINKKIIDIHNPQRGDVMVFKCPKDMSLDYIKRVVAVPGDKITYKNKRLTINGEALFYTPLSDYLNEDSLDYSQQFIENISDVQHTITVRSGRPSIALEGVMDFLNKDNCSYNTEGFTCTVPAGNYFMMGDNRDNSEDSRYWGFVPDKNIVGKAFLIWMNLGNFKRIGTFFK